MGKMAIRNRAHAYDCRLSASSPNAAGRVGSRSASAPRWLVPRELFHGMPHAFLRGEIGRAEILSVGVAGGSETRDRLETYQNRASRAEVSARSVRLICRAAPFEERDCSGNAPTPADEIAGLRRQNGVRVWMI